MPTEAVWMVVTVPQKTFEKSIIALKNDNFDKNDQIQQDYYIVSHDQKRLYMERILEESLEYLNIHDAVWVASKNGHYFHVYFTCDLNSNDHTMHYLKSRGIGSQHNSTIGYIPFSLFYYNERPELNDPNSFSSEYYNEIQDSFIKTITSRLTVAQVVEGVRNGALITFDYYMYLLWSSVIAAMAIMNTAPIDIAASMMIEPLMGCVMSISFGLAIMNKHLIWIGFKGLSVGMLFCLIFGYIFGLLFQIWRVAWNPPGGWPTPEMAIRGEYRSLIYGAVIATAGGAVLAVTLLKNNLVALTGIAVATTFMPPILNSGLCFALATHLQVDGGLQQFEVYNMSGQIYYLKPAWTPPTGYQVQYSNDMRFECCILGAISCAYTLVNVFCLLAASYVILKIKEIVPIENLMPNDHKFFSEDIKIYRAHSKKYPNTDQSNIGQQILEEWADISGIDRNTLLATDPDSKVTQVQTLEDIVDNVEADPNYQIITRGAFGNKYQPQLRRRLTQADSLGIVDTLGKTRLNNLGIYTVGRENDSSENVSRSKSVPFANNVDDNVDTGRGRQRNSLRYAMSNPLSVWPVSEQTGRRRSRASYGNVKDHVLNMFGQE